MSPDDTARILKTITHMVFGNTVNLMPAAGFSPVAGGWPAPASQTNGGASQAAEVYGFHGESPQLARTLTVPPASGETTSQMQAWFLDCLFVKNHL